MPRFLMPCTLAATLVLAAGCGSDDKSSDSSSPPPASGSSATSSSSGSSSSSSSTSTSSTSAGAASSPTIHFATILDGCLKAAGLRADPQPDGTVRVSGEQDMLVIRTYASTAAARSAYHALPSGVRGSSVTVGRRVAAGKEGAVVPAAVQPCLISAEP